MLSGASTEMKNSTLFATERKHEVVSIGRLAVDLYANQYGCDLEDVSTFAKYLGGSSGNVAFGCARLGLRSAMTTRVGNEQMGRFLTKTLSDEGCDVSQIKVDPETGLGDAAHLEHVRGVVADFGVEPEPVRPLAAVAVAIPL